MQGVAMIGDWFCVEQLSIVCE